jgi:hypothetical protein
MTADLIKLRLLHALDQFGGRAVTQENLYLATRLLCQPAVLTRGTFAHALRGLECMGAVIGVADSLERPAWRLTASGRALLAELMP